MKVDQPVVRILKKLKTEKGTSALAILVKHLIDVEALSISEVAALLEIGEGSISKMLKK